MKEKIKIWLEKATKFYVENYPDQTPDRKDKEAKRLKMNIHYYTVIYAKMHKEIRLSLHQKRNAAELDENKVYFPHQIHFFLDLPKCLRHP